MDKINILGVDTGFAETGLCIVEFSSDGKECLKHMALIRTQKDDKKRKTLASDDNHRRCSEIALELNRVIEQYNPVAAAAESQSIPRNSATAFKLGLGFSVLSTILALKGIPLAQASPQKIKKIVGHDPKATKQAIQKAIEHRFLGQTDVFRKEFPKSKWEHGFDAVAAVVACEGSDVIQLAKKLVRK